MSKQYTASVESADSEMNFNDKVIAKYGINIADSISFEHQWENRYQCICFGDQTISSTFNVPGLGVLSYRKILPCCRCSCCHCFTECCACCRKCCDFHHYYRLPIYELHSNNLTIACYEGNYANVYLGNQLFAEMVWPGENFQDLLFGRCQSSYPQIVVQSGSAKFLLKPDNYSCPQLQSNLLCLPCAPLGFFTTQRQIYAHRSKEIKAPIQIINKRGFDSQARFHLLPCCCDDPNYPEFNITFNQSITQQERLIIVIGLIQMSFHDQWSTIEAQSNKQSIYHNFYNISKNVDKMIHKEDSHHDKSQGHKTFI